MKRIITILKGKLEDVKLDNKVKRIESALNNAKLNAETELLAIEDQMTAAVEKLTKTDVNINEVITELQHCINRKKEINDGLNTIAEIDSYLNETVSAK
jgi:hypothetical protein